MRTDETLTRIRDANPVHERQFNRRGLDAALDELRVAVIATPSEAPLAAHPPARLRGAWSRRAAIGLLCLGAAAALILSGLDSGVHNEQPAYAAETIRMAEANPRLLVTAEGWSVVRADELSLDEGEMVFSDGEHELEIFWRAAGDYEDFFADRAAGAEQAQIEVLGQSATMFTWGETGTIDTLLPPRDRNFVEVRGDIGSREDYLELLGSIEPVGVEEWLAALPPTAVLPGERTATIQQMLEGIPLPPGFDERELDAQGVSADRNQLGSAVTGAVTCRWLDLWADARASGDANQARRAREALGTATRWPILLEMDPTSGWPESIWDWAEDGLGSTGFGPDTTRNYHPALGCPKS